MTYLTKPDPAPFQHQQDFFAFAQDKRAVALLAGVGTGKSRAIIDVVVNLYAEGKLDAMLIVAPNGLAQQWVNEEMKEWCSLPFVSYIYSAGKSEKKTRDFASFVADRGFKIMATNVEIFSRDTYLEDFRTFLKAGRVFLVMDEVHTIKNPEAVRTQNITLGLSDVTRHGKRIVGVKPLSEYRAALTGTMVSNSPIDLYSVFNFLKPDYFGMSFSSFKSRYSIEKMDKVPSTGKQFYRKLSLKEMKAIRDARAKGMNDENIGRIFGVSFSDIEYICDHPDVQAPYKNLDELKRIIAPISFIIKTEDCLDMPDKVYEKRYVDMGKDQAKVYKELATKLETELRGQDLSVPNALSLLVRLSQITSNLFPAEHSVKQIEESSPKIEALIDILEENQTFPCLVVSRFTAEVKAACEALKKQFPDRVVEYIIGDVPDAEREDIKSRYKAGEVDVLVATPGTVGTGLNLQIASVEYFLSNDYSFVTREQTEGRVHRAGQKSDRCVFVDFIARGSIDERIYAVLREKRDLLEYMRGQTIGEFLGGRS